MIPCDFDYYKPDTIEEAVKLYKDLKDKGKIPKYYSGGTEIITMSRASNLYMDAIIDLKGIPQCRQQEVSCDCLNIGASLTLTEIAEANLFPLLSLTVQRIADHTVQDKITLGGNICGTIIYKEGLLPLLVSDSYAVVADYRGLRNIPVKDIFQRELKLNEEEFIVSFVIRRCYTELPYLHAKRTKSDKINYPLITLAAILEDNKVKMAFSGLCRYPIRSVTMEDWLNSSSLPEALRIQYALKSVPDFILDDLEGSASYRRFLLESMLHEVSSKLGV